MNREEFIFHHSFHEFKHDKKKKENFYNDWDPQNEIIIIQWIDEAACYKYLCFHSFIKYNFYNKLFTIPVIIVSSITGISAISIFSFYPDSNSYFNLVLGFVTVFLALVEGLKSFLKIGELKEKYYGCNLGWERFEHNLKFELSKKINDRTYGFYFINFYRVEFEKLKDLTPVIDEVIIHSFKKMIIKQNGFNIETINSNLDSFNHIISFNKIKTRYSINNINQFFFDIQQNFIQQNNENIDTVSKHFIDKQFSNV